MFAAKNELFTTPSGYQIQRSLRFRSSASAYLNRTFGTPTNNNTWTFSTWMKRGSVSSGGTPIFVVYVDGNNYTNFTIDANQQMNFAIVTSGVARANSITSQVFRDPSSWYHVVLVANRAEATEANRIKMYINGVQVTAWATAPTWNNSYDSAINGNGQVNLIGNRSTAYFDGYLAEINFIDGQALTPASFGAINAVTGVWSATKYAGTYGTNGFYLNFTDNSAATAATIGKDYSGNGNNWTPNNISVTAGSTYDSMLDAPLGAGGGERGNYAVLNAVDSSTYCTLSSGNLQTASTSGAYWGTTRGTIGISSGKWYWEVTLTADVYGIAGILDTTTTVLAGQQSPRLGNQATGYGFYGQNGQKINNNTLSAYSTAWTVNDVIGVALDIDAGTLTFYKNGTTMGQAFSGISGTYAPAVSVNTGSVATQLAINFGQRPFSYTPPTGFKALHTGNLAAPVIALPAQNMAATLYTGTGATQSIVNTVNGVSFQPDLVWVKGRSSSAQDHLWVDSVRGISRRILSNTTAAEVFESGFNITAFNSSGFTAVDDTNGSYNVNGSVGGTFSGAAAYVGWQWKAGGTAVSNTAGSITSSVSANTTAGFSVVTFSMASGNNTAGHGLGVTPSMIILKERNAVSSWLVFHGSVCTTTSQYLSLNQTIALSTFTNTWGTALPTSSVFSVTSGATATTGNTVVAYCFTPVAGYSAFGSYTGNGSADGPFVFLGFRPKFIMFKESSGTNAATSNWIIMDSSRGTYNAVDMGLSPNLSNAEFSSYPVDFLSNGYKIRTTNQSWNESGGTFIYAAFAESPFKNSLAR